MGSPPASPDIVGAGRRDPRRRLTGAGILGLLAVGLLLAVPDLRPVLDEIVTVDPGWLGAAIALELASCASFVVLYRVVFDRIAPAPARTLAWTSIAGGALLPAGGAGGLAISGWLVHLMGHDTGWIIRRSSIVFVLTSAASVGTAIAAGCLALAGLGGPTDLLRGGLPVLAGCAAIGVVVALARSPRLRRRRGTRATHVGQLLDGARDAGAMLVRPTWRVAGAVGYLWFDIAALWATFNAIGAAPPLAALVLGYHAVALWVPGAGGLVAYVAGQRRLGAERAYDARTG